MEGDGGVSCVINFSSGQENALEVIKSSRRLLTSAPRTATMLLLLLPLPLLDSSTHLGVCACVRVCLRKSKISS